MNYGSPRLLAVGFAAAGLAVVLTAGVSLRDLSDQRANARSTARSEEVIAQLDQLVIGATRAQAAMRAFALTGSDAHLRQQIEASAVITTILNRLRRDLEPAVPLASLAKLSQRAKELDAWHEQVVRAVRTDGVSAARDLIDSGRGTSLLDELGTAAGELIAEQQRQARARAGLSDAQAVRWHSMTLILSATVLGLLGGSYGLMRRLFIARAGIVATLQQSAASLEGRIRERMAELGRTQAELKHAIEEQARRDATLRETEARFHTLLDQVTDIMIVHDGAGRIVEVNERACAALDRSREELLATSMFDVVAAPSASAQDWTSIPPGTLAIKQAEHRRKDGTVYPVEVRIASHDFGPQRLFIQIATDITQRRAAERIAALSNAIINSSNDAIITVTLERTIATWNPAAERLLGYRAAEIVGRSLLTLVPSEHEPEARLSLERLTQGKLTGPYETLHRHKDGRLIPVAVTTSALVDPRGALLGGMGIVRDISERKQLEAEVLRVSDREQQRIGHELHDNVGQQLTAIELMLHQLIGMRTDPPVRDLQIERIAQHVRTAMRDVRGLARGLTPHLLDANELPTALAGLLELTAGTVAHRLSCPHPISGIGNDTATHLYRIAQEAINNALKHSGATLIEVRLQQEAGALHLTIADNGRGFDTRESDARGVGLHIMQYRATLIGGRLTFDSRPGRGLTVQCVLPLAS